MISLHEDSRRTTRFNLTSQLNRNSRTGQRQIRTLHSIKSSHFDTQIRNKSTLSKATESLDISNRKLRDEHPIRSRIFFMGLVRVVLVGCRIRDTTILFLFGLLPFGWGGEVGSQVWSHITPPKIPYNAPKYSGTVKANHLLRAKYLYRVQIFLSTTPFVEYFLEFSIDRWKSTLQMATHSPLQISSNHPRSTLPVLESYPQRKNHMAYCFHGRENISEYLKMKKTKGQHVISSNVR